MSAQGNINDLELGKFIDLAGESGIRVHLLHGDNWRPSVENVGALPGAANVVGDIRQLLDTGVPYRWNGSAWVQWVMTLSSNDTVTGTKTFGSGKLIATKPVIKGTDPTGKTYNPATGAQTVNIDCAEDNMHIVTGNTTGTAITFTVANVTNSQVFIISILQGTTPSTIEGWFATIRWAGGTVPTLTPTAGKRDTFGFIRTGANTYDGFIIGQNI